jgi:hypothetical protein
MKYLVTTMATDWPKEMPWQVKLFRKVIFFIPDANPDYDPKMYLIKRWLIEFTDTDGQLLPWREIALGADGKPVFAGPDERNYGFWLDTNLKYEDFEGDAIDKEEFERYWKMSGVKALEI